MYISGTNMKDALIQWVSQFPDELAVVMLAMLPITELRASIPVALLALDFNSSQALFFSYLGNLVPVILLFLFLPSIIKFLETNSKCLKSILDKYFHALEKKHIKNYHKYGTLFLVLFVAIPLPGSGVWSGSLLAILFNINKKLAIPAIIFGMILSGIIVTLLTQGGINLLGFL